MSTTPNQAPALPFPNGTGDITVDIVAQLTEQTENGLKQLETQLKKAEEEIDNLRMRAIAYKGQLNGLKLVKQQYEQFTKPNA